MLLGRRAENCSSLNRRGCSRSVEKSTNVGSAAMFLWKQSKKHESLVGDSPEEVTETFFSNFRLSCLSISHKNHLCGVAFLSTCEKSEQIPVKRGSLLLDLPKKSQETPRSWHEALILPRHRTCHQMSSVSLCSANIPGVLSPESRAAICPRSDKMPQFFTGLSCDLQSSAEGDWGMILGHTMPW